MLASLSRELPNNAGAGPFYQDCRTAVWLLGIYYSITRRLLTTVRTADGISASWTKCCQATRKANEYRNIAD